jgi:hypothetical protein
LNRSILLSLRLDVVGHEPFQHRMVRAHAHVIREQTVARDVAEKDHGNRGHEDCGDRVRAHSRKRDKLNEAEFDDQLRDDVVDD